MSINDKLKDNPQDGGGWQNNPAISVVNKPNSGIPVFNNIQFKEPIAGAYDAKDFFLDMMAASEYYGTKLTEETPEEVMNIFNQQGMVFVSANDDNYIKLVVLGEPKAQKRHRHVNMGKFVRQYDPSASDKGDFLSMVQNKAPQKPFDVPLALDIRFYFTRPKSHYKTGKNAHLLKDTVPVWHVSKPDTDNCFKFVTDALNKIFWRDDSLICSTTIQKQYSENPRIEIKIKPL